MSSQHSNGAHQDNLRAPSSVSEPRPSSSTKRQYTNKKESMNGPLYMQTVNRTVLVRRVKRKGDGPSKQLARWFVENQIGMFFPLFQLCLICLPSSGSLIVMPVRRPGEGLKKCPNAMSCRPTVWTGQPRTACCVSHSSTSIRLSLLPSKTSAHERSRMMDSLLTSILHRLLLQSLGSPVLRSLLASQVPGLHLQVLHPTILQHKDPGVWRRFR